MGWREGLSSPPSHPLEAGELYRANEPVWRRIQRLITSDTKPTKVCVISMSDKLWFAFRPL